MISTETLANRLRATYFTILGCMTVGLYMYMALGPTPLDGKIVAWSVVTILGSSIISQFSVDVYIRYRTRT
jgi:hypothetical protein